MKEEFEDLYEYMAGSGDTRNMKVFGCVLKEMMYSLIDSDPEKAQEYITRLSAVKWKNYLTEKEADCIVEKMKPEAPWSFDAWKESMKSIGIATTDEPYYNEYALYVVMNMVYSDNLTSIMGIARKPLSDFTEEELISDVFMLSVDKLKDEDGVFDVRRYFFLD